MSENFSLGEVKYIKLNTLTLIIAYILGMGIPLILFKNRKYLILKNRKS